MTRVRAVGVRVAHRLYSQYRIVGECTEELREAVIVQSSSPPAISLLNPSGLCAGVGSDVSPYLFRSSLCDLLSGRPLLPAVPLPGDRPLKSVHACHMLPTPLDLRHTCTMTFPLKGRWKY